MSRVAILLAASAVALTAGCGYALVGAGRGALPEGVKTVYVQTFVNETATVGLEQRLTDAVLRELSARARLKPVSDRSTADAELTGNLTSYSVQAVRFDSEGRAIEYQVAITAKVTLLDRTTEKPIFSEPSFIFREPYTVPVTTASYFDRETQAVETMARPFARSLVTAILEGF